MPQTSPTFSDASAEYAIPRAILAPHIMPTTAPAPRFQQHNRLVSQIVQQQYRRPQPPPEMHNPSVLHPVFFTENLQRRRSFGQPAVPAAPVSPPQHSHFVHNANFAPHTPYNTHPAFFTPLAPPAPPLPHASSPVAHGYIYQESPSWPIPQRARPVGIGIDSKL
ncbi:hypothetical protein SEUCBS139899_007506 [Sporothrix eucalyptigena]